MSIRVTDPEILSIQPVKLAHRDTVATNIELRFFQQAGFPRTTIDVLVDAAPDVVRASIEDAKAHPPLLVVAVQSAAVYAPSGRPWFRGEIGPLHVVDNPESTDAGTIVSKRMGIMSCVLGPDIYGFEEADTVSHYFGSDETCFDFKTTQDEDYSEIRHIVVGMPLRRVERLVECAEFLKHPLILWVNPILSTLPHARTQTPVWTGCLASLGAGENREVLTFCKPLNRSPSNR